MDAAENEYVAWVAGGDTGISSLTIWSVLSGMFSDTAARFGHWPPSDPSDFGRCYRLLKRFPAWRARLGEVSAAHPRWTRLVEHWAELESLYEEELPNATAPKLYARMKQLEAP